MPNIITNLASSSHSDGIREEHDYYATDPYAMELLLEEEFGFTNVLEPCCGEGHLSKVMLNDGIKVTSSDLIDRKFGTVKSVYDYKEWTGDVITNPPYGEAQKVLEHLLSIVEDGSRIILFLKLLFLESKGRKELFKKYPPKRIYISSSRIMCAKNGDFKNLKSSAVCYAWFVWVKGYTGKPEISWVN